ncbi:MAG: HAD-IIA family hydrolase [Anaerolineae bacterium]|nr:HAD-IIA family hydrolase [Anaerolineae bacterium]
MEFALPTRLYDGYIFDLDGTVYLSNKLLPGAKETIETLRAEKRAIAFVSNNPTRSRQTTADKLTGLGIPTGIGQVINSTNVLVNYLLKQVPGAVVFPIGEQPLHDELAEAGFVISDDAGAIDFVIASFDRTFVYHKLQIAFNAIRAGARFIATNADRYCPVAGGGEPDAASIIAAIEACTETSVEIIVGKPSMIMAQTALEMLGVEAANCMMTGDRLATDILMGKQAGMATTLTLTGATTPERLLASDVEPDFVIERLSQILPA